MALLLSYISYQMLRDDKLSEESLSLLQISADPPDSEAFFFLLGILAAPEDDPVALGREAFSYWDGPDSAPDELYDLQEPDGPLFCNWWEDDCLGEIVRHRHEWRDAIQENAVLLHRVDQFCMFDEFATQTIPDPDEPVAPYQHLVSGSRLKTFEILLAVEDGDHGRAAVLAEDRMQCLRKQLQLQDSLIGQVSSLVRISEALDVASIFRSDAPKPQLSNVAPLNAAEKRIDRAMSREFNGLRNMFTLNDSHNLRVRVFFKPNATTNRMAPHFWGAIESASGPATEFSNFLLTPESAERPSSFRNILGEEFIEWMIFDHMLYVGTHFDLDQKIRLYNLVSAGAEIDEAAKAFKNPYFKGKNAYVEDNSLCFEGLREDRYGFQCLRLTMPDPSEAGEEPTITPQ